MTEKLGHVMHPNSLEAYSEESQNLSQRKAAVVAAYRIAGRPLRDREVMCALGFRDMNAVRPTITALIHDDILHEVGSQTDPDTGRTVRLVTLTRTRMDAGRQN